MELASLEAPAKDRTLGLFSGLGSADAARWGDHQRRLFQATSVRQQNGYCDQACAADSLAEVNDDVFPGESEISPTKAQ